MRTIFAVYKPKGMTSHDVVDVVRSVTGERKVGHAGTLDPLAEGVLVVGVGREATTQLDRIVRKEKEYRATVRFGMHSTTDDEEGEKREAEVLHVPVRSEVETVMESFCGTIMQVPPSYSAAKVKGTPAYRRMRRGEEVELPARTVLVKELELIRYEWPLAVMRAVTGPGVYVRSLARDIGRKLGTGGYLAALTRTRVGEFSAEDAVAVDELRKFLGRDTVSENKF